MKLIHHLFPLLFAAIFLLLCACEESEQSPLTIHLAGNSTMADKPETDRNPERGWGQVLGQFFNESVTIRNHAKNGRSTKSFLEEGKWNRLMDSVKSGDYVFIQFGHNDQKAYDPSRYTNPYSSYRRNLEKMVGETRELGAYPVILSSIVRRKFNSQGTLEDTHGSYPYVARQVAMELQVPFIDLQGQTEELIGGLGPAASTSLFLILQAGESEMYPEGITDNTHLNVRGANEVARMVASSIRELEIPLSEYLHPEVSKPRILIISGGHDYDTCEFRDLFQDMEDFRFDTISHPQATTLLASSYVHSYDLLLFYDYVPGIPLKDSSIYQNLGHHGLPMLFLHHSICSFQQWEGFRKIVGGCYIMEGYGHDDAEVSAYTHDLDMDIRIVDPDHPVTAGLTGFSIRDEGYSNIHLEEGLIPLLETDHPDSSPNIGWTHSYGKSVVLTFTLGHDRFAYQNKDFRQLLLNSLYWLTGEAMDQ